MPERPLPPEDERLTLKEAAQLFDPPKSDKAVQQLIQRDVLPVARERDEQGRTSRVFTTREWVEEYVQASGGRARLREPGAPRVLYERAVGEHLFQRAEPTTEGPLRRLVRELSEENIQLRLRVAELESQLERR